MRILLFTCLFLSLHFSSISQSYSIKGKIKGWKDTVCYFGNHYGEKKYVKDTARIDKNGNFVFEGKEKLPGGIYLIVYPNKNYSEMVIDHEQNFKIEIDTAKLMESIQFKGSEENTNFYKFQNFVAKQYKDAEPSRKALARIKADSTRSEDTKKDSLKILQKKLGEVDKSVESYQQNFIKENPNSFVSTIFKAQKEPVVPETPLLPNGKKDSTFPYRYFKDHYWDNISLTDDRLLRTPIFHNKLKFYFDKMVMQHPDSIIKEADIVTEKASSNKEMFKYITYYITTTYETSKNMGMDAVFVHEVEKYYMTGKAFWVDSIQVQKIIHRGLTLKPLLLGKQAPPMIMQDTLDKNISLYEVKSKYTVLVFWDPDCGHCQKVMPKLKEVYENKLKAKGVTVYSVDIEDVEDKWKKFLRDKKLNFINVHDKYKQYYLRQMYDIYSTPVIYLLDTEKKIRAKRIEAEQIDGFIDHLEKAKEKEKKQH